MIVRRNGASLGAPPAFMVLPKWKPPMKTSTAKLSTIIVMAATSMVETRFAMPPVSLAVEQRIWTGSCG